MAVDVRALLLAQAGEVEDMARWIAMVTVHANRLDAGDGRVIRDSQAENGCRRAARRRRRKRKVERMLPQDFVERLLKLPRLADLKQRVLARAEARVSAQPEVG